MATFALAPGNIIPGAPGTQWVTLSADAITPVTSAALTAGSADIKNAVVQDGLVNTPGGTPLPPPDNFRMIDATVNVSLSTPGDVFEGTDPLIKAQFLNLTPDTLGIAAVTPNVFIKTDIGNDVISAFGGRNIISAGAGGNTLIGGDGGEDTFLSDVRPGNVIENIFGFRAGDDAAVLGLSPSDFSYTLADTLFGLQVSALPTVPGKSAAQLILNGYTTADINSRVVLGFGTTDPTQATPTGIPFLFAHAL